MPAVSKAQQKFMGMVHAAQKGDMENPSPEVSKAADSMSDKDAKDFASTSHKGLPDKIKEMVLAELRSVKAIQTDYTKVIDAMEKHLAAYKKSKGTPAEKEHIQKLKTLTAQKKKLADELNAKVSDMYKDAELKVDEMNTTGGVEGYNTPFAFSGKDSEEKKGKRQADLTGYSVVNEANQYKKGDKLKIKLPNGKKFDVVFVDYSGTKGIAFGKFKIDGEVATKPFSLSSIVESVNESDLKGYLVADVVDDIVKSIGSKFVSGEIKNAPNRNYIYLKLTDIKFGSGVVKMLKSQFGIDAKIDKTFGHIPSVSFASKKVVSESVNEDKVYIDFLNKKKGFKQDRIKFNSYEDAVKWARKNFEKFNADMIKYESINEAIQNAPAKNGKELADFILRHYDFYTDYIDDGGQRRRAIKSNEGTIEWFDSHPIDLKKEALKILQSKVGSSGKSQIQRVFGKSTMDK
jgi:hypothetical protein